MAMSIFKKSARGADYPIRAAKASDASLIMGLDPNADLGSASYYLGPDREASGSGMVVDTAGEWFVSPAPWNPTGERTAFGIRNGEQFRGEGDDQSAATFAKNVERFKSLAGGYNPDPQGSGPRELVQNAGAEDRVALFDFVFGTPPGLKAIWGLLPQENREEIRAMVMKASRLAMEEASRHVYGRRGKDGLVLERSQVVAGLFSHSTSQAGDAFPHLHATLVNLGIRETPDDKGRFTGSFDTDVLFAYQGVCASVFNASLAEQCAAYGMKVVAKGGSFDIEGVPLPLQELFCKRTKSIEEALLQELIADYREEGSLSEDQVQSLAEKAIKDLYKQRAAGNNKARDRFDRHVTKTRGAKAHPTMEELEQRWLTEAEGIGFTRENAVTFLNSHVSQLYPLEQATREELLEQLPRTLTDRVAVLKETQVFVETVKALIGKATLEEIWAISEEVKDNLVCLERPERVPAEVAEIMEELQQRYGCTQLIAKEEIDPRHKLFTSRDMCAVELEMIALAKTKSATTAATEQEALQALAAYELKMTLKLRSEGRLSATETFEVTDEQRDAHLYMMTSERSDLMVRCLQGSAGSGKSVGLQAGVDWRMARGDEVHTIATAWTQAQGIGKLTGTTEAPAIAVFLMDLEKGRKQLKPGSLIIVDEAGNVGSRPMRQLLKAAHDAKCDVWLVGHTEQTNAIEAGGAFRVMVSDKAIGHAEITKVVRQENLEHRKASELFPEGLVTERDLKGRIARRTNNVAAALDIYDKEGSIRFGTGEEATDAQLVQAWLARRLEAGAENCLMLATTNEDARRLNDAARAALKGAGELQGEGVKILANDSVDANDLQEFVVGDVIQFRRNRRELGIQDAYDAKAVYNRTCGIVTSIRSRENNTHIIDIRLEDGKVVRVDTGDTKKWSATSNGAIEGAVSIQHAICQTVYSAQGATYDHVFLRHSCTEVSNGMDIRLGYVGFTRHRKSLIAFLDRVSLHGNLMADKLDSEWVPIRDVEDKDLLAHAAYLMSQKPEKVSTLDYDTSYEILAEHDARIAAKRAAADAVKDQAMHSDADLFQAAKDAVYGTDSAPASKPEARQAPEPKVRDPYALPPVWVRSEESRNVTPVAKDPEAAAEERRTQGTPARFRRLENLRTWLQDRSPEGARAAAAKASRAFGEAIIKASEAAREQVGALFATFRRPTPDRDRITVVSTKEAAIRVRLDAQKAGVKAPIVFVLPEGEAFAKEQLEALKEIQVRLGSEAVQDLRAIQEPAIPAVERTLAEQGIAARYQNADGSVTEITFAQQAAAAEALATEQAAAAHRSTGARVKGD